MVLTGDPGAGATTDPYRMLNTAAFAPPQPGSLGFESARYFVYGPGINSLDLSIAKSLRFGRARAEVRLDAFHALNHTQFSGVNATVNFRSLTDPTVTNLPYDASGNLTNRNGFGTVNGARAAAGDENLVLTCSWSGRSPRGPAAQAVRPSQWF